MIDNTREIEAFQREVGEGSVAGVAAHVVRLCRTYNAPIDDVWDALTNPERIGRWFLPISGDYRVGGTYQFEGNAGGKIVSCDRPNSLRVTWGMAEIRVIGHSWRATMTPRCRRTSHRPSGYVYREWDV